MMYYKEINGEIVFFSGSVLRTANGVTFNPTEEQILAAGWQVYEEPEPTEEELLEQAKNEKLMQIENYDASENVERFYINGTPMWLGHEVRQQIKTSVEAYVAMGAEEVTKIFNGVEFTFGCQQWLQMLAELEVYAADALNTTEHHKINVNSMDNVQDVIDYDYTTGYPRNLVFGKVDD